MDWWRVLSLAVPVWIAINAVIIIMQRRSAAATLAWLLALVFLPFVGIVAYRLIGPLRLERRKRRRVRAKRLIDEGARGLAALDSSAAEYHQLAMVSMRLGGAPPLRAESVDIYTDGASCYAAMLADVASARDHVHLEYYIWDPDTIGTQLRDLLVARARAGATACCCRYRRGAASCRAASCGRCAT